MALSEQEELELLRLRKRRAQAQQSAPVQQPSVQPQTTADQMRQAATGIAEFQQQLQPQLQQRVQNVQQTLVAPGPNPVSEAMLAVPGQTAGGVFDVLGTTINRGAEMFAENFPKTANTISNAARNIAEFEKEHLNLSGAISSGLGSLQEQDPKGFRSLGDVANIAVLATPQAAAARTPGSKLISSAKKSVHKSKRQFVNDLLIDPKKDIDRAFFKKGQVQFRQTRRDAETAAQVSRLKGVSPKKNIIENRNVIEAANAKVIDDLSDTLNRSTAKINHEGAENLIDATLARTLRDDIFLDEPGTLTVRRLAESMKQAIREQPNTPAGLWAARKKWDAQVRDMHPKAFEDNMKPFNHVVQQIRSTTNDIIHAAVPGGQVRQKLAESHRYFNALNKTKSQAVAFAKAEAPSTLQGAVLHALNIVTRRGSISQPTKAGTGFALAGAAYIAGYPTIATIIGAGTGVLTAGAIAANIAKSPITRRALGEALSMTEDLLLKGPRQASVIKQLRADRAALIEILENYPEDEDGN